MKLSIPEELKGKELYQFIIQNKSALIAQKKSLIKKTEAISYAPEYFLAKDDATVKALAGEVAASGSDTLHVKVVANACWWMDSQKDVLLPDAAAKSIRERKGLIPHLHDHIHELDAEVGDVKSIYYQNISLRELGVNKDGAVPCIIFESEVKKSYNEKIFDKYKNGKIKQHSIGLSYVKIELAVNDPDYEKEQDFWNKYIDQIINREDAEKDGYFWVVSEFKLLENSAVLLGSNMLTPTLEAKTGTDIQPPTGTEHQPSSCKVFDIASAIKHTQFNF